MKKLVKILCFPILALVISGCYMPWEKDTEEEHLREYEPITGKFVLHDALDKRYEYHDTYFIFDGSRNVKTVKYYENGELKREGQFNKILTYKDRIGKWCDNLHLNIKIDSKTYEHISTYTESFEPLNQFRILEEYKGFDERFFLSELPYVMGTYVRENAEFVEEKPHTNTYDMLIPTEDRFTAALDGFYKLDDEHYFYFLCPRGWCLPDEWGYFYPSYYQYYAPNLEKPLEGFAKGFKNSLKERLEINLRINRNSVNEWKYDGTSLYMGYPYLDDQGIIDYKYGTVDFSNGSLNSFTFEHVSIDWTEDQWNKYVKGEADLPDPIQYDFVGGTYVRA